MPAAPESDRIESVTAFTRRVKGLLETGLGRTWVRGEVSNLRLQSSGHCYFSLKDAGAQLSCVLFRGDAARQTVRLRDGAQVMVLGDISVYEARGQYQLIVRAVVEDGEGKLQQNFEALKRRLAAEGLFEAERKRALPVLPLTVGFVTSPTGAALQDFIRIMSRRGWRGRLVVLPARVQGAGAAEEIAAMVGLAGRLGGFDVLVVGRGGGSLEDLWAFNEEVVVRAVATCPVPVISAVGHEIDFTLSDFAADVRAETPSGAAELLSSRYAEVVDRVETARENLDALAGAAIDDRQADVESIRARLALLEPRRQIEQGWLRRDDLAGRLQVAWRGAWQAKRAELREAQAALAARSPERRIEVASHQLLGLWKRLQSASPASVLQRGFVIMRDEAGKPVARRDGLKGGQSLRAEFHDGQVDVEVL